MVDTPPLNVEVRSFRWQNLPPAVGEAMIELARSLGLDPDHIAADFAISRLPNRPWRLHLTQFERGENGEKIATPGGLPASRPLVFEDVALPDFLTREDVIDEMARLAAEVERLREVVARAERDNCGCLGYPLDGSA